MSEVENLVENQASNALAADNSSSSQQNDAKNVVEADAEEKKASVAAATEEPDETAAAPEPTEASKPAEESPKTEKKTPAKRTPSKRLTFIERAQKESEELVKTMGGSLEMEGGRRTRSSARGTPSRSPALVTPPPAKKPRTSPASAAKTPSTPKARGRGRKIATTPDAHAAEEEAQDEKAEAAAEEDKVDAAKKEQNDAEDITEKEDDSAKKDEEKKPAAESKEVEDKVDAAKTEEAVAEDTKADETDATKLSTIPEASQNSEKQAEVDEEAVEKSETEVAKQTDSKTNTTPMETDEPKTDETKASEKPVAEEAPAAAKPVEDDAAEPMEVDSSSKSNDVEMAPVVEEKVEASKIAEVMDESAQDNATSVAVEVAPAAPVQKPETTPAVPAVAEADAKVAVTNNDATTENAAAINENEVNNEKSNAHNDNSSSVVDSATKVDSGVLNNVNNDDAIKKTGEAAVDGAAAAVETKTIENNTAANIKQNEHLSCESKLSTLNAADAEAAAPQFCN